MKVKEAEVRPGFDLGWVFCKTQTEFYKHLDRVRDSGVDCLPELQAALALLAPDKPQNKVINEGLRSSRHYDVALECQKLTNTEASSVNDGTKINDNTTPPVTSEQMGGGALLPLISPQRDTHDNLKARISRVSQSPDSLTLCGDLKTVALQSVEIHKNSRRNGNCIYFDFISDKLNDMVVDGLISVTKGTENLVNRVNQAINAAAGGTLLLFGGMSLDQEAQLAIMREISSYAGTARSVRTIWGENISLSQLEVGSSFFSNVRKFSDHLFWLSDNAITDHPQNSSKCIFSEKVSQVRDLKSAWEDICEYITREALNRTDGRVLRAIDLSGQIQNDFYKIEKKHKIKRKDPWDGVNSRNVVIKALKGKDLALLLADSEELLIREALRREENGAETLLEIEGSKLREKLRNFNINPDSPYDYSVADLSTQRQLYPVAQKTS